MTTWNFDDGKIPVNFVVSKIDDNRNIVVKDGKDLTNGHRAILNTLKGWELATGSIGSGLPSALGNYSLCSMNGKFNSNYPTPEYFKNTHADLVLTVNAASGGTLKFKYTGSSETNTTAYDANYDYFILLVDGTDQANSTVRKMHTRGENHTSWDEYSLDLAAGEHTIIFRYYKDWGTDSNADRYCIDEIQFETSSTCQGLSCSGVSGDTYPGANILDLTSEECDPSDPGITSGSDKRTKLCNSKLGLNVESYHNSGTIGCGVAGANNACRITGNFSDPSADNYPCGFCGDGHENGGEECDVRRTYTKTQLCHGENKVYVENNIKTLSFSRISDSVISIEDATIRFNKSTKNSNGWYLNANKPAASVVHSDHSASMCARNYGDANSTNEIEFSITPEASGEICFWWVGESEAGYDKFTYKFNGETRFDGISGDYKTYQQQCETVTAGETYTFYFKYVKNGSTNIGLDIFCIDDITIPITSPVKTLSFTKVNNTEISIEDATINYNKSTNSNGTPGNANGWYLDVNKRGDTFLLHSTNHAAPLCARNYGDANRTNEIEFALTPEISGEICFWWMGQSEEGHDKFTYKFNGETRFDGISGSHLAYKQQCESVTAGSTYTFYFKYEKNGSTDTGIDIFCIDDITIQGVVKNCSSSCQKTGTCYAYCGDGEIQSANEECEYVDGAVSFGSNMDSMAFCNSSDSKKDVTQSSSGDSNYGKGGSVTYIYTGNIETWEVKNSGVYEIEVVGARGGHGYYSASTSSSRQGCRGARMKAQFKLTKGQKVRLLAGKHGGERSYTNYLLAGGGGGGSFAVLCKTGTCEESDLELLVAAGGGGGGDGNSSPTACSAGSTGENGVDSSYAGGTGGNDGTKNNCRSWGGRGWNSHKSAFIGTANTNTSEMYGEQARDSNSCSTMSSGDPHGGFGGGGSAYFTNNYCYAGGGGGYSGGGAGNDTRGGGGGGSYINESSPYFAGGKVVGGTVTEDDGKITIKMVKYPGCTRGCRISDSDFVNCGSRTAGCINVPENAVLWGSSIISQEWKQVNGSWQWSPSNEGTYSSDTSSTECSFHCRAGYVWENSKCILDVVCTDGFHKEHGECVLNTQYDIPCEGQPDDPNNHAHWNAPGNPPTITQEWICENDNCAWSPRAIGEFKQETNASYCYFSCDTGYHWDKNTQKCEDNTRTTDCDPLPNIDSEWNDNGAGGTFTQNWNTSLASCTDPLNDPENCWEPASMGSVYNNETAGTCRYKCKSGYVWISSKGKCLKTFMSFENNGDDTSSELMLTSTSGDYKWERLTSSGNDGIGTVTGSYSMCSTNKGNHGSTSTMTVKVDMPEDGYFTFYVKGEGEGLYSDNYDRLNFYVDDTLSSDVVGVNFNSDGNVSGWRSWSKKVVYLTAGEHTLQFDYKKDGTTHRGKDRFCIDDLRLEFGSVEWPNCSSNIGSLCKHNGLFWSESSSSTKTWSDANSSCSGMGTGWRLPTINELRSLVQNCSATQLGGSCQLSDPDCLNWNNCGGSTTCKPNCSNVSVIGDTIKLWSSSRDTSESSEWYLSLDFSNGKLGSNGGSSNNLNYRCVYPAN